MFLSVLIRRAWHSVYLAGVGVRVQHEGLDQHARVAEDDAATVRPLGVDADTISDNSHLTQREHLRLSLVCWHYRVDRFQPLYNVTFTRPHTCIHGTSLKRTPFCFFSQITQINLHIIFTSCSWRNSNSKYFNKIWQLIKYSLLVMT